jgi:hypothetical protein
MLFNYRDFFAARFMLTLALLAGLFFEVPVPPAPRKKIFFSY